jgi:hypothetical protein
MPCFRQEADRDEERRAEEAGFEAIRSGMMVSLTGKPTLPKRNRNGMAIWDRAETFG